MEQQLDRKHHLSLQTNAVDQLDAEFQRYTKKIRGHNDVPEVLSNRPGSPTATVPFDTDESAYGTTQKVTKSTDNDNDDDQDDDLIDDQDEKDGEGEEAVGGGLIQELQALEESPNQEIARGKQFQKPQHKPQLSVCQSFLYDFVWSRLDTFLELSTVEKKDVFVAISGIVDLDVHKDFPQHAYLLSECRAAIELQYPKIRDHLQTYRQFVDDNDGLKEARLGELMKQLQEDMSRFKNDSDEMVTIEILRILGETILKEAQQDQLAVRKVTGVRAAKGAAGAAGRRLDFRLVASIRRAHKFIPFTLCNNEHKAPDTKPQVVKIQHRKNMRLNKSIAMNGWIPRETSTMFLDVVGLESDWNIITPHGDVMLSCQVQEGPLILPANAFEMGTFLCEDGVERLLGYR
ncbi:hypothetical protein BGZ65_007146, partial [Modicella reniformis]